MRSCRVWGCRRQVDDPSVGLCATCKVQRYGDTGRRRDRFRRRDRDDGDELNLDAVEIANRPAMEDH